MTKMSQLSDYHSITAYPLYAFLNSCAKFDLKGVTLTFVSFNNIMIIL